MPVLKLRRFAMPKVAGRAIRWCRWTSSECQSGGRRCAAHVHRDSCPADATVGRHDGRVRSAGKPHLRGRSGISPCRIGCPSCRSELLQPAGPRARTTTGSRTSIDRAQPLPRLTGRWNRSGDSSRTARDWSVWDAGGRAACSMARPFAISRAGHPARSLYLPMKKTADGSRAELAAVLDRVGLRGGILARVRRARRHRFAEHFAAKAGPSRCSKFLPEQQSLFKRDRGNRWDACSAAWIRMSR